LIMLVQRIYPQYEICNFFKLMLVHIDITGASILFSGLNNGIINKKQGIDSYYGTSSGGTQMFVKDDWK